ncbi:UNVERIFIED_CONTAM: hypothetical protein NCL1_56596 [Trichonephila clavipes]
MYLEFTYKLRPLKGYDLKVSYTRNYRFSKKGLEGSLKKGRRWGKSRPFLLQLRCLHKASGLPEGRFPIPKISFISRTKRSFASRLLIVKIIKISPPKFEAI